MLKYSNEEMGPGDWAFGWLSERQANGGRIFMYWDQSEPVERISMMQLNIPLRDDFVQPEYMKKYEPGYSRHWISIRTDGTEERIGYGEREWWWNMSLYAPTIRASLLSHRYVNSNGDPSKIPSQGIIHGFLTDGHWKPWPDDTLTKAF